MSSNLKTNLNSKIFFCFTLGVIIIIILQQLKSKDNLVKISEKYIVSKCACEKTVIRNTIKLNETLNYTYWGKKFISHCSFDSDKRGGSQNVISYSLFAKDKESSTDTYIKYKDGIERNAIALEKFYQENFTIRIYSDLVIDKDNEICQNVICKYSKLDWCDMNDFPDFIKDHMKTKMAWRFLVMGDPLVDKFLSRDLDSVLSSRERDAVAEWEKSGKAFHSMRDNPQHFIEILGGMFGGNNLIVGRDKMKNTLDEIIMYATKNERNEDQIILKKFIFGPFEKLVYTHDSYNCQQIKGSHPWPTKRKEMDFVGNPIIWTNETSFDIKKCPEECRLYKDWEYC